MAGGVPGGDFDRAEFHAFAVLHGDDAVRWRGQHGAPERVHLIAIDHAGAVEQTGGVDQVPRGTGMAVNRGAILRKPAGRPGVIEMDVGDEDFADRRFCDACGPDRCAQRLQRRSRPGFDECVLPGALDEVGGDEAGGGLEKEIESLDAHERTVSAPSSRLVQRSSGGQEVVPGPS